MTVSIAAGLSDADVAYAIVNVLNASGDGGSHTELWRSDDAGATWSPLLTATA